MDDRELTAGLRRLAGRDAGLSRKKEETRRRIVEGAAALFQERGVRRTSMEDIAERAGISRATLYTYASNKEDVVIKALAEEHLQRLETAGTPGPTAATPRAALKHLIADSIAGFERTPLLALLVKGDPDMVRSFENRDDVKAAFPMDDRELLASAITAAAPGVPAAEVEAVSAVVQTLRAAGPYLVENASTYGLSAGDMATRLADLLVEGLTSSEA